MRGGNKGSDVTAFTGSQTSLMLNNQQSVQTRSKMHFTRGFIPGNAFLWLLEGHNNNNETLQGTCIMTNWIQ